MTVSAPLRTMPKNLDEVFVDHHNLLTEKRQAMEMALAARGEIERAVRGQALRKARLTLEVSRAKDEDGKQRYKNADEREAALTIALWEDEVYCGEHDMEIAAREKLGRADIDIDTTANLIAWDKNLEAMLTHKE